MEERELNFEELNRHLLKYGHYITKDGFYSNQNDSILSNTLKLSSLHFGVKSIQKLQHFFRDFHIPLPLIKNAILSTDAEMNDILVFIVNRVSLRQQQHLIEKFPFLEDKIYEPGRVKKMICDITNCTASNTLVLFLKCHGETTRGLVDNVDGLCISKQNACSFHETSLAYTMSDEKSQLKKLQSDAKSFIYRFTPTYTNPLKWYRKKYTVDENLKYFLIYYQNKMINLFDSTEKELFDFIGDKNVIDRIILQRSVELTTDKMMETISALKIKYPSIHYVNIYDESCSVARFLQDESIGFGGKKNKTKKLR